MHKTHRTAARRAAQKTARRLAAAQDRLTAQTTKELAPTGYHLTWTSSGSTSSGYTFDKAPSYYQDEAADYVVAPVKFVERYARRHDPRSEFPGVGADAVRAYARAQGWPCG